MRYASDRGHLASQRLLPKHPPLSLALRSVFIRVEVLGGVERRRRWSDDEKMRIIAETLAPGAKVAAVARRHGVSPSLLFFWRRQARTLAKNDIVRRDSGKTYRQMLTQMAKESGVATPTIDDLVRLDRKRKGKKLSNQDWTSPTDPDAKIAKMKDGTTHLAYKPEHAVDLDTGVIVAAPIHPADEGDTTTLAPTLEVAQKNLSAVGLAPTPEDPCDLVADKGYHSRAVVKDLDDGPWKTRIAEPRPSKGYLCWQGDEEARAAVYGNRNRLRSGVGKEAMRKRGEIVERSFAHVLERGGMRRTWLRGRQNVHKRYLVHVAGYNLGILMRALLGAGTPRETAAIRNAFVFVIHAADAIAIVIVAAFDADLAAQIIAVALDVA